MASQSPKSPLTTSSAVSPIPTPTYPNGGLFTILTTTTISAPLSQVVEASLDFRNWEKWNTFVPRVTFLFEPFQSHQLEVGKRLTFHSKMSEDGPTQSSFSDHEVVSVSLPQDPSDEKKEAQIVWKTVGIPGGDWVMRAERVQEFVEREGEGGEKVTDYKTWGTFGGPMAYGLSWMGTREQIVERFRDWANDLKEFVERGVEG